MVERTPEELKRRATAGELPFFQVKHVPVIGSVVGSYGFVETHDGEELPKAIRRPLKKGPLVFEDEADE